MNKSVRRSIRRIKKKFKQNIQIIGVILALCFIFAGAFFLIHGESPDVGDVFNRDLVGQKIEDSAGNVAEGTVNTTIVSGTLEVHYIDVGQGDATLIRCGDNAMLIDAGENDKGTKVQAYLKSQGITRLDYVIGTHPDSDHIGGLDVVIYKFECGNVFMPDKVSDSNTYADVLSAVNAKSYKLTVPPIGQKFKLGEAEFTIISPVKAYRDNNNCSLSLILQYGNKRFLFTGDAEEEAERECVKSDMNIDCDVYKVGHHGSKTSSGDELLNAASPAYAVISCGAYNEYGHPHSQTMNNLRSRGVKVFRTDEQGTIVATTDGNDIKWNCSPSESWKAGE